MTRITTIRLERNQSYKERSFADLENDQRGIITCSDVCFDCFNVSSWLEYWRRQERNFSAFWIATGRGEMNGPNQTYLPRSLWRGLQNSVWLIQFDPRDVCDRLLCHVNRNWTNEMLYWRQVSVPDWGPIYMESSHSGSLIINSTEEISYLFNW